VGGNTVKVRALIKRHGRTPRQEAGRPVPVEFFASMGQQVGRPLNVTENRKRRRGKIAEYREKAAKD